jgi:hypothetical protein
MIQSVASVRLILVAMSGVVCVDAAFTVLRQASVASIARAVTTETGIALSTDTDKIAHLDTALSFRADSNCDANDFVPDNAWVFRSALSILESVLP